MPPQQHLVVEIVHGDAGQNIFNNSKNNTIFLGFEIIKRF